MSGCAMRNTFQNKLLMMGLALLCSISSLRADDLEYRFEIGGLLGGCSYYGDANYNGLLQNINIMTGLVGRYNINPRMAVKANFSMAKISGNTADGENRFPGGDVEFSRTIYDLGAQFECNFFAYGSGASYKGTRRLVPYIFAGLGMTYAPEPAENVFTVNLPVGVGVKYKFAPRWNVGCEFTARFTASDDLDVTDKTKPLLNDPYGIKSSSFKNKDSYSFLSIFVTYDISPKYRRCNN